MRFAKLIITALLLPFAAHVASAGECSILEDEFARPGVAQSFKAGARWFPYPEYRDRDGWKQLFEADSAAVVGRAEKYLTYRWQTIPVSAYLAFERSGDRTAMERPAGENRAAIIAVVLAELAEGKGRFLDAIADFTWAAAQEPSWVLSAHQGRQTSGRSLPDTREHFIDLGSGRLGAAVAVSWYFFHEEFDKLDPSISLAVLSALDTHIFAPYLDDGCNELNWWQGFTEEEKMLNNWNPWCNSDVILSFLLAQQDQGKLDAALSKAVRSVDLFLSYISSDGACEEGPSYWDAAAGKVFDFICILSDASCGAFDVFGNGRIRTMCEFFSRSYAGGGYVSNFADAHARAADESVLCYRMGKAMGSRELLNFGLYQLADHGRGCFRNPKVVAGEMYRTMEALRAGADMRRDAAVLAGNLSGGAFRKMLDGLRDGVPSSTWYPETQILFMRNSSDWFVGAKGGHNNESHNHNDVGTFILYVRDIPVFVDAGVGTYTRDTFSKNRYKIWTMQSLWHNLPAPNGVAQKQGRSYHSADVTCNPAKGLFSLEIAGAYPEKAAVKSWKRSYALSQGGSASLVVSDSWRLSERKKPDCWNFLVKAQVLLPGQDYDGRILGKGEILLLCDDGLVMRMSYPKNLKVNVEDRKLDDPKLSSVWGPVLRRISFIGADNAQLSGSLQFRITEKKQ